MTKERQIEILMKDRCTRGEAEKYIKRGCSIYEDFEENFEEYMNEWKIDEEYLPEYEQMIKDKVPAVDWGIVKDGDQTYYIQYVN